VHLELAQFSDYLELQLAKTVS